MEATLFELDVGEGSVGAVGIAPYSFAVDVVDEPVGVVRVDGVASEPARRKAGAADAGVGHPGVEPCFDNG